MFRLDKLKNVGTVQTFLNSIRCCKIIHNNLLALHLFRVKPEMLIINQAKTKIWWVYLCLDMSTGRYRYERIRTSNYIPLTVLVFLDKSKASQLLKIIYFSKNDYNNA